MKRFTSMFVISLFASSLIFTPVFATTSAELEQQAQQIQENKEAVESEVSSLQEELTVLVEKISKLEGQLIEKGQEIIQATEDLKEAEEIEADQYESMKIRIKFMYEEGNTTAISTIFAAEDFSDLLNKAEYVSNVHTYDRQKLNEYIEIKEKIKELKEKLEVEMAKLEELQKEFEANKEELNETIEAKRDVIADLDVQLQAAVEAAAQKRREEEEERRRQEEARRRAEEEQRRKEQEEQQRQQAQQLAQQQAQQQEQQQAEVQQQVEPTPEPTPEPEPAPAPSGNSSVGNAIVAAAYGQIGVPYVWGGSTPGAALDCSGLVQYCLGTVGISVPHYSESIYAGGTKVSNPEPGDVCWTPGHVAIYIGDGKMIEAQQSGTNIMVSNVRASGFCRYW